MLIVKRIPNHHQTVLGAKNPHVQNLPRSNAELPERLIMLERQWQAQEKCPILHLLENYPYLLFNNGNATLLHNKLSLQGMSVLWLLEYALLNAQINQVLFSELLFIL